MRQPLDCLARWYLGTIQRQGVMPYLDIGGVIEFHNSSYVTNTTRPVTTFTGRVSLCAAVFRISLFARSAIACQGHWHIPP